MDNHINISPAIAIDIVSCMKYYLLSRKHDVTMNNSLQYNSLIRRYAKNLTNQHAYSTFTSIKISENDAMTIWEFLHMLIFQSTLFGIIHTNVTSDLHAKFLRKFIILVDNKVLQLI